MGIPAWLCFAARRFSLEGFRWGRRDAPRPREDAKKGQI